ncbi:MAG: flavodoxin family protein [Victivallales bacterium]|nr:flavodoxin family protein [Victivallales bacterium]
MKAIFINGSPRKNCNTASLLEKAMQGAADAGSETKLVHLRDLKFGGCVSCLACKVRGNKCAGLCAFRDELRSSAGRDAGLGHSSHRHARLLALPDRAHSRFHGTPPLRATGLRQSRRFCPDEKAPLRHHLHNACDERRALRQYGL